STAEAVDVDALFLGQPPRRGRQDRLGGFLAARGGLLVVALAVGPRRGVGLFLRRLGLLRGGRRRLVRHRGNGPFLDPADHGADGDLLPFGDGDAQAAGGRGRHFLGGLLGLQRQERLVGADGVAVLLQPA